MVLSRTSAGVTVRAGAVFSTDKGRYARIESGAVALVLRTGDRAPAEVALLGAGDLTLLCTGGSLPGGFEWRTVTETHVQWEDGPPPQAAACAAAALMRREIGRRAACNALHTHAARLAGWVDALAQRVGNRIEIARSSPAVALGSSRESASRAMRGLVAAGGLRYREGSLHVLDLPAVTARACGCRRG